MNEPLDDFRNLKTWLITVQGWRMHFDAKGFFLVNVSVPRREIDVMIPESFNMDSAVNGFIMLLIAGPSMLPPEVHISFRESPNCSRATRKRFFNQKEFGADVAYLLITYYANLAKYVNHTAFMPMLQFHVNGRIPSLMKKFASKGHAEQGDSHRSTIDDAAGASITTLLASPIRDQGITPLGLFGPKPAGKLPPTVQPLDGSRFLSMLGDEQWKEQKMCSKSLGC
ncbi:hypothetical protein Sango_2292600 [Sesamum angolense]|uniref:Uncharacterized protein n=1 Tax=Sesamum angolense TaxID=2727404 RepID=A0AAE2BLA1_9LAMI|nr:hypothetical protein Sango_2292600 [Sesamum angolense]